MRLKRRGKNVREAAERGAQAASDAKDAVAGRALVLGSNPRKLALAGAGAAAAVLAVLVSLIARRSRGSSD